MESLVRADTAGLTPAAMRPLAYHATQELDLLQVNPHPTLHSSFLNKNSAMANFADVRGFESRLGQHREQEEIHSNRNVGIGEAEKKLSLIWKNQKFLHNNVALDWSVPSPINAYLESMHQLAIVQCQF